MIPIAATTRLSGQARFTPRSVFGNQYWWEGSFISANDNDGLAGINDLSGNGISTTATGTQKPLFKTNIVNGNPAVLFDGLDDRFSIGAFTLGALVIAAKYTRATFNEYKGLWTGPVDAGDASNIYLVGDNGTANWFGPPRSTITIYKDGAAGTTAVTNAWHVFAVIDSSPQNVAWLMGTDRSNGGRIWDGYVYGVAAYNPAPSVADLKRVAQYFAPKIGVSIP